eukprot:6173975-Pleurochrysis_carterae.AAC.1
MMAEECSAEGGLGNPQGHNLCANVTLACVLRPSARGSARVACSHRDELAQQPGASQLSHGAEQRVRAAVDAEDETVEEDEVRAARVQVVGAQHVHVLHAQVEAQLADRRLRASAS